MSVEPGAGPRGGRAATPGVIHGTAQVSNLFVRVGL